jgi:Vitamin K-dependent gamma-carboxylase
MREKLIPFHPLNIADTSLPPNILLMAKLIASSFLLVHWQSIPGIYLPFVPLLDSLPTLVSWRVVIQVSFLFAFFLLMINWRPRAACITLGLVIVASVIASRPYFNNNKVFAGCILFLAGLTTHQGQPWLIRCQVALVYFGAGLNKALDIDWRSGQFFENWMVDLLHQPLYLAVRASLPPMALSFVVGWATIVTELSLAVAFLVPRLYVWAIATGVVFHSSALVLAHSAFGVFYYAMLSAYLAFIRWPSLPVTLDCGQPDGLCRWARLISDVLAAGHTLRWRSDSAGQALDGAPPGAHVGGLQVILADGVYTRWRAWGIAITLSPATYFVAMLSVMAVLRLGRALL